MNAKMFGRSLAVLALLAAGAGLGLTGCQSQLAGGGASSNSTTNWSDFSYSGSFGPVTCVSATVTKVGPPEWCYAVEGFYLNSGMLTNGGTPPVAPMPGNPGYAFFDYGSFTNLEVSAPACSGSISTPGWGVAPGSHVSFTNSGAAAKTSLLEFCLSCDKTNGTIQLKVAGTNGTVTTIGPLAGPQ